MSNASSRSSAETRAACRRSTMRPRAPGWKQTLTQRNGETEDAQRLARRSAGAAQRRHGPNRAEIRTAAQSLRSSYLGSIPAVLIGLRSRPARRTTTALAHASDQRAAPLVSAAPFLL